jgi:hypothetical protein
VEEVHLIPILVTIMDTLIQDAIIDTHGRTAVLRASDPCTVLGQKFCPPSKLPAPSPTMSNTFTPTTCSKIDEIN